MSPRRLQPCRKASDSSWSFSGSQQGATAQQRRPSGRGLVLAFSSPFNNSQTGAGGGSSKLRRPPPAIRWLRRFAHQDVIRHPVRCAAWFRGLTGPVCTCLKPFFPRAAYRVREVNQQSPSGQSKTAEHLACLIAQVDCDILRRPHRLALKAFWCGMSGQCW